MKENEQEQRVNNQTVENESLKNNKSNDFYITFIWQMFYP